MNSVELQNLLKMLGDHTTLLAVSKTIPSRVLREAHSLGISEFGENRFQELAKKQIDLQDLELKWHFIGQIQSNKAARLVGKVSLIHSVDRFKIWNILKEECNRQRVEQACLVQVNISNEPHKAGVEIQKLIDFLEKIDREGLQFCKIKGLMCIGSSLDDAGESVVRAEFESMQNLFNEAKMRGFKQVQMEILSMGMSSDYQLALEYGSNMVRLGSALFGSRDQEFGYVV